MPRSYLRFDTEEERQRRDDADTRAAGLCPRRAAETQSAAARPQAALHANDPLVGASRRAGQALREADAIVVHPNGDRTRVEAD